MISEYPLIPDEAFLFIPHNSLITETRNNETKRIIFGGGVPYSQTEISYIESLKKNLNEHLLKWKFANLKDDLLLRFLQATSYDIKECMSALESYVAWIDKTLPLEVTPNRFKFLSAGIMYLSGRDCFFRPIIVIDVKKILDIKIKEEQLLDTLSFYFQYVIENCLIEGQVETWNTIIDLGNCGVFSLGNTLLDIIKHMSNIFRARLNHNYLINCPSTIKIVWSAIKKVLNEDQIRKISIVEKKTLKEEHFLTINKHQVEQKYGGFHPNIINYWPIEIVPYECSVQNEKVNLITKDEYESLFNKSKLKDRKIKKTLIKTLMKPHRRSTLTEVERQSLQEKEVEIESEQQEVMYPEEKIPPILNPLRSPFSFSELF